jgi:GTP pyrophosphokinase
MSAALLGRLCVPSSWRLEVPVLDVARVLLLSLLTGSPLGRGADALASADRIDELASAFFDVPGALALGVSARQAQLAQAPPQLAHETLTVVAPLVERMGLGQARAALEDLSFARLDPAAHALLAATLGPPPSLAPLVASLGAVLSAAGIDGAVTGRVKSLYGVHAKMSRKGVSAGQVFDRVGLRVVVADVGEAYAAVAAIHAAFAPIPGEFDDYVATPKPSGYRALHTAVEVPGVGPVEVQVRSAAMHDEAERGVAAHWRYKLA